MSRFIESSRLLLFPVLIILGLYFLVEGLIAAKSFLAPLIVASLMTMILLPVVRRLERIRMGRGGAAFIAVFLSLICFTGLFFLVSMQGKRIADDWPEIKEQMAPKLKKVQHWIKEKTGISPPDQKEYLFGLMSMGESGGNVNNANRKKNNSGTGEEKGAESLPGSPVQIVFGIFNFMGLTLLTGVYMFFMLLYRIKLKKSVLKFFSNSKQSEANDAIQRAIKVSQSYLAGRLLLILILAILYSIGLLISGVNHAILISVIAALLSLLPYIGNIIGYALAISMALFSGGDLSAFLGVTITFSLAQFVESYILEPYIVGHKVELNPLATIIVVVLGGAVWGIIGMIIFIPLFGIIKIVFDQIPALQPLGYTLGEEGISDKEDIFTRMGRKVRDKFSEKE